MSDENEELEITLTHPKRFKQIKGALEKIFRPQPKPINIEIGTSAYPARADTLNIELGSSIKQPIPDEQIQLGNTRDELDREKILQLLTNSLERIKAQLENKPEGWTTPKIQSKHDPQLYSGQEGKYSCLAASTHNALQALGLNFSEHEIIKSVGGNEAFARSNGFLRSSDMIKFLQTRHDLAINLTFDPKDLVRSLDNGGVALFGNGKHARMISGIEKQGGQLLLRIHDPFKTTAETMLIDDFIEMRKKSFQNGDGSDIITIQKRPDPNEVNQVANQIEL